MSDKLVYWTEYYFAKNLQGDVIGVYRVSDNEQVAEYQYDAWGNIIYKSGDLADINPFRYRTYNYDNETWFYYLQSRYYDPAIGRFINADAFVSTGQGLLGNNMFAYCLDNPVCRKDVSGTASVDILDDSNGNNIPDEKEYGGTGNSGQGGKHGNGKGGRGVGGKGWRGDQTWKGNVKSIADGGDIRELNGGVPTIDEAKALIAEARGVYHDFHPAHPVGGISIHTYNHIHYLTATGIRSTIQVQVYV